MRICGVAAITVFLLGTLASQEKPAEKNCNKETSQLEMNRCWDERRRQEDTRLAYLYGRLISSLQTQHDDPQLASVKESQKAWIAYRDLHCAAVKQLNAGGSMESVVYSFCVRELTEHRSQELQHAYGNVIQGRRQPR